MQAEELYKHIKYKITCFVMYIVPLVIATLPENATVDNGDSASFTFGVTGSDIINITWISSSGAVINATSPDVTVSTNTNQTALMSSITISNLQRDPSEGWYTCICYAMNRSEIYYIQAQVYLFVQGTHAVYVV